MARMTREEILERMRSGAVLSHLSGTPWLLAGERCDGVTCLSMWRRGEIMRKTPFSFHFVEKTQAAKSFAFSAVHGGGVADGE